MSGSAFSASRNKRTRRPNPWFNTDNEEVEALPGTVVDKEEPPTKKPKKVSDRVDELEASLSKQEEKLTEVLTILSGKFAAHDEAASPYDAQDTVKPKDDEEPPPWAQWCQQWFNEEKLQYM